MYVYKKTAILKKPPESHFICTTPDYVTAESLHYNSPLCSLIFCPWAQGQLTDCRAILTQLWISLNHLMILSYLYPHS